MASKKPAAQDSNADKAVISVRIPAELRQKLDRAVEESGKSLTEEIAGRLFASFAAPENDPNRELLKDIGNAIRYLEGKQGKAWAKDPWVAQQLALAMAAIVRERGPMGDPVEPKDLKPPKGVKPSAYGEWVGETVVAFGDLL